MSAIARPAIQLARNLFFDGFVQKLAVCSSTIVAASKSKSCIWNSNQMKVLPNSGGLHHLFLQPPIFLGGQRSGGVTAWNVGGVRLRRLPYVSPYMEQQVGTAHIDPQNPSALSLKGEGREIFFGKRDSVLHKWHFFFLKNEGWFYTAFQEPGFSYIGAHQHYIVGSYEDNFLVWDTRSRRWEMFSGHEAPISAGVWSNNVVVTGAENGEVLLWNFLTNEIVDHVQAHDGAITAVGYKAGWLVTASGPEIKVWSCGHVHDIVN